MPAGTLTTPVPAPVPVAIEGIGAPIYNGVAGLNTLAVIKLRFAIGAPFRLSLANIALPTFGLPVVPLMPVKLSGVATIGAGLTVTLTVVVLQFVGLSFSHSVYVME